MGLRLKFNLVLIVVFLAGFAAAGAVSRQLLLENAREEVIRDARLMMEAAISVRTYTVEQVRPHALRQLQERRGAHARRRYTRRTWTNFPDPCGVCAQWAP